MPTAVLARPGRIATLTVSNGALLTAMPLVPMMMTTNAAVAQSDCLFYATIPGR